ncbi:transcriptional repressor [Thermosyntropha sp.]|uniref:Fur family transcriptional regulator n=1 Tax=Thermosyntropha sp. TaxID=2740820 RepID=UPI0025F1CABE|nr:transcriptional repressor [Thermosyntropha sp.]MBO8158225.1 transcriptional repressor [Thermosyntropha sp.]
MQKLLEKISGNGYKITPQRKLILQVLMEKGNPLTAEEIAVEVKKVRSDMSTATVYRNLSLMTSIGIINKFYLESEPAFYELAEKHGHHMRCISCGRVYSLNICPLNGEVISIAEEYGFTIKSHYFEIGGYCRECSSKNSMGG